MKQLLEELLINNNEEDELNHIMKEMLLLNTSQLYKKLEQSFYTTSLDVLNDSYEMKEQYRRDYRLNLGEMYYNLGLFGRRLEELKHNEKKYG